MPGDINNLKAGLSDDVTILPMTIDVGISESGPLDFMFSIPLYPRFYFSMRDENRTISGCGLSILLDSMDQAEKVLSRCTGATPPCFAAVPFDRKREHDDEWKAFDKTQVWIPSLFTEISDKQNRLCITLPVDISSSETRIHDSIRELIEALENRQRLTSASGRAKVISRTDTPDANGYTGLVQSILDEIASGSLTKAVAARRTDLEFDSEPDAYSLFNSIKEISKSAYSFIIQPDDKHTFLGFTPERLFRLENGKVTTGSGRGTAPSETAEELLNSAKDLHEHSIVIDYLKDSLAEICSDVSCDCDVTLKNAGAISHLYSRVQGELAALRSVPEVLDMLHPTPAVCGKPKDGSLVFITKSGAIRPGTLCRCSRDNRERLRRDGSRYPFDTDMREESITIRRRGNRRRIKNRMPNSLR